MSSNIRISGPDLKVKIKWDNVLDVIPDLGIHGIAAALGIPPGPDSIVGIVGKLKGVLDTEEPLESQAWSLVALCFASAIDELCPKNSPEELRNTALESLKGTKTKLERSEYYLTPDFFITPVSLPLYKDLRKSFVDALEVLWPESGQVGGKLDSAFNCALYEIIRHDPLLFEPLRATVSGPGLEANRLEHDWTAYRERLKFGFYVKPVFGQEETHISLSQLYVPPRAYWYEIREEEGQRKERVSHLLELHCDMTDWLNYREPDRCVRLIRGGPGCGKSSYAKFLAATLAADQNWRPLLIELQRLKGSGSLTERTSKLLVNHQEYFSSDPLDKTHLDENRPLVLIFDGLDELAVPNSEGAQRIAENFWDDLDELMAELNSNVASRACAIVTGRDAIIQAALRRRGRKLPNRDALEVCGLHGVDTEEIVLSPDVDPSDQRSNWWRRYATATGAGEEVPPVFSSNTLGTLTDDALLCYLLAISGKAVESRDRDIDNANEIYDKLIGDVWSRVWGPEPNPSNQLNKKQQVAYRQQGAIGAFKDQDAFEQILEYIAIAAWRGGESRIATLDSFESAINLTAAEDIWTEFQKEYSEIGKDENFTTLALTFFFRKQDLADRGFEFTHRTFGEYLVARCLVRQIERSLDRYSTARSANDLSDWLALTGDASITPAIGKFLRDEIRQKPVETLRTHRDALETAIKIVMRDGLPVRIGDKETWRNAETRQRYAEGALLACASATSLALLNKDPSAVPISLSDGPPIPPGASPRHLLSRLEISERINQPIRLFLSGLNFSGGESMPSFYHKLLMSTNWEKSVIRNAQFFGSIISYSNFSGTDLQGADFEDCDLYSTIFSDSNVSNAWFRRAKLGETDFSNAVMVDTVT